ncbi:18215_t:CDS:2, partial [Gigaspora rosea]
GLVTNKPVIRHEKMSSEKNAQFQSFLMDKANVIMSSYKTDTITNELVYCLKNSKDVLWNKFHEEYPNGMCRTSFYTRLEENKYIYQEDLVEHVIQVISPKDKRLEEQTISLTNQKTWDVVYQLLPDDHGMLERREPKEAKERNIGDRREPGRRSEANMK